LPTVIVVEFTPGLGACGVVVPELVDVAAAEVLVVVLPAAPLAQPPATKTSAAAANPVLSTPLVVATLSLPCCDHPRLQALYGVETPARGASPKDKNGTRSRFAAWYASKAPRARHRPRMLPARQVSG
jgi:hypothetical protein